MNGISLLSVVPSIVPTLIIVVALAVVLADELREHPLPFYIVFWALAGITFLPESLGVPHLVAFASVAASCYTGVAIYLVVMFAGALPKKWGFTKKLLSIRSELSIIGGVFVFAHVCRVIAMVPFSFTMYWSIIWRDAALPMLLACGVVGPLLLICFIVPWVTSFKFIRNRMQFTTWKKIQKLAYPFMILMVLQGMLLGIGHAVYLGPTNPDSVKHVATAAVYGVLGIAYLAFKAYGYRARNKHVAAATQ